MSELIQKCDNRATIRWKLLTGASALALAISSANASADDTDHPTLWIELGGQLEQINSARDIFTPPFFGKAKPDVLAPMVDGQLPSRYSIGSEGKLTFLPQGSDWILSATIRYGRSNANRDLHHETTHPVIPITEFGRTITHQGLVLDEFGDAQTRLKSSHAVLDFQVGKDVGFGMFGAGSMSVFNAGVRFAQFTSSLQGSLHARPVYGSLPAFGSPGKYSFHNRYLTNNTAVIQSKRSTYAIGPTISWDAYAPIAGNASSAMIALDWGLNAGVLFGRQRAHIRHQTSGAYFNGFLAGAYGSYAKVSSYAHGPYEHDRSRTVTIPNVGGFAGVSFRYLDAKVKFGYRADFFFGAIDGGIDTAKKENVGFYGPFASISVGIGG